ncbi:class I SAM-dependent methyltransferase [Candidatus Parcubacteria bacterium]|nr:class I SAM-dependent methyltransferase [Candidatus Parcubacteria bacterium]
MLDDERVIPNFKDYTFQRHWERYKFACPFTKGKKVLSVACGTGYGEHYFASKGKAGQVLGLDYSQEAIEYANNKYKHPNLSYMNMDARDLSSLESSSFDLVVSFETIEHLDKDKKFLSELKRLCRPGGKIILSTPNKAYSYRSAIKKKPLASFHIREYRENEFKRLISEFFDSFELYGQKIILKRSLVNLPKYLYLKLSNKLKDLEKEDLSVKPYPKDNSMASCSFLVVCQN